MWSQNIWTLWDFESAMQCFCSLYKQTDKMKLWLSPYEDFRWILWLNNTWFTIFIKRILKDDTAMKGWLKHLVKSTITAVGKDLTNKTFATYIFQFQFFSFTVKTEFPSKIGFHIFMLLVMCMSNYELEICIFLVFSGE